MRSGRPIRLLAAAAAAAGLLSVSAGGAAARMTPPVAAFARSGDAQHLYRIIGKVRLLPFWISADDVGGARITWTQRQHAHAVSLLIGSDPQRAPRQLNEWGYIREEVDDDINMMFGVRTLNESQSPEEVDASRGLPFAEFGIICSAISPVEATSRTASIRVPRQTTYRQIGRVLDAAESYPRWDRRWLARPSDAAPGFLTALDLLMRSSIVTAADPAGDPRAARFGFVYRDAVYDLLTRRVERVAERRTRADVFENLLRSDVSVKKRSDGTVMSFSITYGTTGPLAGVPIAVQYQPKWWFRIELELDEGNDVPADPVMDPSIRERVDALCAPRRVS